MIRIYEENKIILKELSQKLRLSENQIINHAIKVYAEEGVLKEADIEKILSAIENSTWGLQVRLNSREASVDSQILLEMMNSITQDSEKEFKATYTSPSELYKKAKQRINDKINKRKAAKKLL